MAIDPITSTCESFPVRIIDYYALPFLLILSWKNSIFDIKICQLPFYAVTKKGNDTSKLKVLESLKLFLWLLKFLFSPNRYAANLLQLANGRKIPPSGWKCDKCDLTQNLWLNLTDGTILCGRKFYDGTGGNDHAVEHYRATRYPLAVKLGTITKEGKGDVFSYDEDDMVDDPNLIVHLAHWGINIAQMEKTDKSMIELELDLNQKFGEWAALQEAASKLTPIYGPGYTGLTNLGNSCYLNSVMQTIYVIPDFIKRFAISRYF